MSAPRRRRAARGFTLIELAIAVAVSSIIVLGALSLLTSQQRAFQTGSADRALQETGRVALGSITANLRMAGYGIDPALAFDFGPQSGVPMARAPEGTTSTTPAFQCGTSVSCRDKTDAPDELVFLYRDPYFGHPLSSGYTSGTTLTITGPLRTKLRAGQILQVMCFTGNMYWAYVTVAADVAATTNTNPVAITITSSTGTDFPQQNAILADSCFNNAAPAGSSATTVASAAKVYKVDRYRYFIRSYDDGGNVQPWRTAGARPYLMLDRGVGTTEIVAPDVEDLQVAYVYPASAAALQLVGAGSGAIAAGDSGIDLAPADGIPTYSDDANAPSRATQHPANIRAVRVAIVVRSPEYDATLTGAGDASIPAAANRPAMDGPPGYRRLLIETTAAVRNLDARAPYFPSYTAGSDQYNVGGG